MKAVYVAMIAAGIVMTGQVQADEALAKAKNCMACHTIDKKLVGPDASGNSDLKSTYQKI